MKTLIDKISDEDWNDPSVSDWNINVGYAKGHGGLGMTDIVKRLRDECLAMTRNEAADEIERLLEALGQIQILARIGNTNDKPFMKLALHDCGTISLAALEESK